MSWLLGSSRTVKRILSGYQRLENDGDGDDDNGGDNKKPSYPCRSVHPPPQCKGHGSSDDNWVEDLGESSPFALNARETYLMKDKMKNRLYAKMLAKHTLELEKKEQEFQQRFHNGAQVPSSLSEGKDWNSRNHHQHQSSRVLRMAPRGSCESFQHSTDNCLEADALASWTHCNDLYMGDAEHSGGAKPHMLPEKDTGSKEVPSPMLTCYKLREENVMLRGLVRSMQSSLESHKHAGRRLKKQLKARQLKEKKEAQERQPLVQQTVQSLKRVTQRALEAESKVEELKQEIFVLRGELESAKAENSKLRASQPANLEAMRENIDFVVQKLNKIIMGARCPVRQITLGVDSLNFVAEILKSTAKISEVNKEP